jgi:hypothetical protein
MGSVDEVSFACSPFEAKTSSLCQITISVDSWKLIDVDGNDGHKKFILKFAFDPLHSATAFSTFLSLQRDGLGRSENSY